MAKISKMKKTIPLIIFLIVLNFKNYAQNSVSKDTIITNDLNEDDVSYFKAQLGFTSNYSYSGRTNYGSKLPYLAPYMVTAIQAVLIFQQVYFIQLVPTRIK